MPFPSGVAFNLPEVTSITPSRIRAGTASTVEVSGAALGVIIHGVIFVGEQPVLNVLSATASTLTVQLPALAVGSYPVCARNELKLPRPCVMLTVEP